MMFSRRPLTRSLLLSLSLAAAAPVHAIGVGNIDILSNLNQPLLAKIHILASPDEGIRASNLKVRVASREQHARYGLPYPALLKSARFIVTPDGNGGFLVRATTSRPVKEPLLNFLLEVDWGKGRLYKEVALLLDPPGYQQLPVTAAKQPKPEPRPATPVAPHPSSETAAVSSVDEGYQPVFTTPTSPLPASRPATSLDTDVFVLQPEDLEPPAPPARKAKKPKRKVARARSRAPARPVLADGRYGPVKAGDSLSKIARRVAGKHADKATIKALMEAIYAANPHAFSGSMDALEKNTYLTIPNETEIALGPSYLATSAAIGISDFVTTVDGDSDIVITEETPTPAPAETKATTKPETPETQEKSDEKTDEKPAELAPEPPPPTTEIVENATGELKILPPDQTAAEISRRMSERMAELDREASSAPPRTEPEETVDNDPAIAEQPTATIASDQSSGSAAQASGGSLASLQAEITSLKAERNELLDRLATAETRLEETEAKLQRLELKISALSKSLGSGEENGFSAFVARWGVWLLLPLLPLLLVLLWWRRRNEQVEEIAAPVTPITPLQGKTTEHAPLATDDIETVETVSRDIDLGATASASAPPASAPPAEPATATKRDRSDKGDDQTQTMDIEATAIDPDQVQAITAPDLEVDSTAEEAGSLDAHTTSDLEAMLTPSLDELDLKPAASDTQETMRPAGQDDDNTATQILNPDVEADAHLDSAEEAEIYLAYGQFSLAEQTIDKLLALEPDNDRYRLLQLKLFAETGRMNELQSLSVQLLEKYPDPESGMHKQVQNISDRAFTKKALREQPDATGETQAAERVEKPAADDQQPPDEMDLTLDRLSVEADKLSTTYADDIGDYISEETLPDLDMIDLEKGGDETVFEDPLASTSDTAPGLELDEEDLTDSELDALTVDLELKDAKLDLDSDDDRTVAEDRIEEFSDTDLRLEPIDFEAPGRGDERLDIDFDLESELEKHVTKANPDDKA